METAERTSAFLGEGYHILLDSKIGLILECIKMDNRLCPSHYDPMVKCIWQGMLIGTFRMCGDVDFKGKGMTFQHNTMEDISPRLVATVGTMDYYFWVTRKYDTGETPEDAKMEVAMFWRGLR